MAQTKVPYGCWFFLAKGEYVDDMVEDGFYTIDSLQVRHDTYYAYDIGSGIFVNVGRSLVFKTNYGSTDVITSLTIIFYITYCADSYLHNPHYYCM